MVPNIVHKDGGSRFFSNNGNHLLNQHGVISQIIIQIFTFVKTSNLKEENVQILCFWTLSIILFLFKTQRLGDWLLSPSSGKTYSFGPN
jgi:uncharacterized membrane protein YoaT (DUF817 family)